MLSKLMKSKRSFILLKFLQSTNMKKNNMNITLVISDKFNFFLKNNTNANENSNN